jgi:hypothetical protein
MTDQPRSQAEAARDWRRERLAAILRNLKFWWLTHDPKYEADRLEILVEHILDLIDEEIYRVTAEDKPPAYSILSAETARMMEKPEDDDI